MGDVIRPEVAAAAAFAPMKAEEEWSDDELARFGEPLHAITPPVNSAERQLLLGLLDRPYDDDVYGAVHTVTYLIESNEDDLGWQLDLVVDDRPWFASLLQHWRNTAIDFGFLGKPRPYKLP